MVLVAEEGMFPEAEGGADAVPRGGRPPVEGMAGPVAGPDLVRYIFNYAVMYQLPMLP